MRAIILGGAFFALTGTLGCSGMFAENSGASQNKVLLGTETIHLQGMGGLRRREMERYSCGNDALMVCSTHSTISSCRCVSRFGAF